MSNLSLAKISNLLGSVKDSPSSSRAADPADLILGVLRDNSGMVPVSELRSYTKLRDDVILDAVGMLRSRQHVEVVELPDQGTQRFIRLTPAGYAHFAA